jgi:hypothetical protein
LYFYNFTLFLHQNDQNIEAYLFFFHALLMVSVFFMKLD